MNKIILNTILICFIPISYTYAITDLNTSKEHHLIGCISKDNKTSEPLTNSKDLKYCKYKNIIMPNIEHLKIFKNLYWDNYEKIANRLSIVNFESAFNQYAISQRNDYWYVQINNWKEFIGDITGSLLELDRRRSIHSVQVCQKIYKIDLQDFNKLYRCLTMRWNWQRKLNNSYSNRIIAWKEYYYNYITNYYLNKGQ